MISSCLPNNRSRERGVSRVACKWHFPPRNVLSNAANLSNWSINQRIPARFVGDDACAIKHPSAASTKGSLCPQEELPTWKAKSGPELEGPPSGSPCLLTAAETRESLQSLACGDAVHPRVGLRRRVVIHRKRVLSSVVRQ
ncbi:hypothetical protein CDAR_598371 [Caerostris darwini]|uniref:Uncharacterized protein n=1 Tax=Caerostris darwini TaxID=1538125 RepID=A0AAV4QIV5_9ARAC|nr:hypothetical protein CDAR_598371 [Caerostris darwini]